MSAINDKKHEINFAEECKAKVFFILPWLREKNGHEEDIDCKCDDLRIDQRNVDPVVSMNDALLLSKVIQYLGKKRQTVVGCNVALLIKQGRIHGQYQLRTGGQGRECAFSHFLTRGHGPTDGRTDKASYRVACPQLKT